MTDEVDILRKAIAYYDKAIRMKNINQELYDQLLGSIVYLFKYSEKYGVPLPKRDELYRMVKKAEFLIDQINPINRKLTGENINREDNSACVMVLKTVSVVVIHVTIRLLDKKSNYRRVYKLYT